MDNIFFVSKLFRLTVMPYKEENVREDIFKPDTWYCLKKRQWAGSDLPKNTSLSKGFLFLSLSGLNGSQFVRLHLRSHGNRSPKALIQGTKGTPNFSTDASTFT